MFLMNAWYGAAKSGEVADKPLGRKICGENIAFFRDAEGRIAAVDDYCPHRGAAMSLGRVCNGNLVCGYHGLVMGRDGKTVSMPMQRVGGFPSVKSYPVEERNGLIWLWPGDPTQADPAAIPHYEWANSPDWTYDVGVFHVKCDYRLMVDNLMDLTHEAYVHSDSIGQDEIDLSPVNTRVEGDAVYTSRFMYDIPAPPFWAAALRNNDLADDVPVDRWQISCFSLPANVHIQVGVAHAGNGGFEADPKYKASGVAVDFMTPETEDTHWYFGGLARNFKADDPELTETILNRQRKIFSQDFAVLESQQHNMDKHPDRRWLMLNIDSGGVQARRILERRIKQEQEQGLALKQA